MENLSKGSNVPKQSSIENILKGRSVISLSFAMVLVLFFFSFSDFRCNGVTVASVSGYNLVFGKHLKNAANSYVQNTGIFDQPDIDKSSNSSGSPFQDDRIKPNIWAILSLAAAITGLFVFFRANIKHENRVAMALGIIGAISLIVLGIAIQNKVRLQGQNIAPIDVGFRAAYWLSIMAFALASTASYFRLKNKVEDQNDSQAPVISKLNVFISSVSNLSKKDS